jgi:hypothetical protein
MMGADHLTGTGRRALFDWWFGQDPRRIESWTFLAKYKKGNVLGGAVEERKRLRLAVILAALGVILSSLAISSVLLQRAVQIEIVVQDVALLPDRPTPGQTELHAYLVLRNLRPSTVAFDHVALWAWDPQRGTLFDIYIHTQVDVQGKSVVGFGESSTLNGIWSEVAFKVRILTPTGWWETLVTPDHPVVFAR